ncbi:serine/threonine protein kinase [Candidatus Magnetoovum chiemensis]|nr:serine/threonine protein kinase [Candidatus Magnetoovum chiemensis]
MKKLTSKIPDWPIGIAITLIILAAFLIKWYPTEVLERLTYDLRTYFRQKADDNKIVLVTIDDESINRLGHWPWPRSFVAQAIGTIKDYGAKVIGVNIIYTEKDVSLGLEAISMIADKLENETQLIKSNAKIAEIYDNLKETEELLDSDNILSETIAEANNVVLPISSNIGKQLGDAPKINEYLKNNSIEKPKDLNYIEANSVVAPIFEFAKGASAMGHINLNPDRDGVIRAEPLFIYYGKRLYPSFALQVALKYLNYKINDVKITDTVTVKKIALPTNNKLEMLISYVGKSGAFQSFSFFDVVNNKIPSSVFRDKIVLIGTTATGVGTISVTPLKNMYGIDIIANTVENILNDNHITNPSWTSYAVIIIMILIGAYLSIIMPTLKGKLNAVISISIIVVLYAIGFYLFIFNGIWIKIFYPTLLLVLGYTAIISKRYLLTEKRSELMEADSIETNKMLGLSFQGQGMLDMAFDKYRKCPVNDESVKELLYNLGLDFERKRMLNKAISVYEHILKGGTPFKDIEQKIKKMKTAGETVVLGATSKRETTVMLDATDTKPTLGRYVVERELGRGAMGIVYLGKDPKIKREVAIKTLRYDEIEEEQKEEIKERFFREAESAGRLMHPNIVKIFDAGEEQEIAYLAMELLTGTNLTGYCSKKNKLGFSEVVKIVLSVADALDYAHSNGVVHRDIKPANIMLMDNKEIRVTDFGIARIMESTKTQTGAVLGTPSYMSPEQIAGKKVDGRSDLFSLGVVFFEMLTGEKPFKGDSIATLMYNITSAKRPTAKDIDTKIPTCISDIINKLLEKEAENRYPSGKELIEAIHKCRKSLMQKKAANT